MGRHELTDEQWNLVRGLLPKPKRIGRPPSDSRKMRERHAVAAAGRQPMAGSAGEVRPVADRVRAVQEVAGDRRPGRGRGPAPRGAERCWGDRLGTLVHRRLLHTCLEGGDWCRHKGGACAPEDHALGRSRGGYGTKIHLVTDGNGIPLAVTLTAGHRHESTSFESTMNAVDIPQRRPGRPRRRPAALAADKAYSYKRIRDWLHRRKIAPVIPQRANQEGCRGGCRKFDAAAYRRRNVVERCVGWLKECRRVATRFERLATSDLGMLKLAMIQRYLRLLI